MIASFLVEGPKGAFLVETGPESCREQLLAALRQRGFDPIGDIAAVFLTHIHLDHAGGAAWWANAGVPVYTHRRGAKHLIDPARLEQGAREVYGEDFDFLWGSLTAAAPDRVHPLDDGATVELAGTVVRAIETPGHAFHHHAYVCGDALFCGDAAGARLPGLTYTSVTSAPPQFDLEHTRASLDRLDGERRERVFLTHFGELSGAGDHFSRYAELVEKSAAFVRDRIDEGMDGESLQVAYEAYQLERAFRAGVPAEDWRRYQAINHTAMCADGLRMYWEKQKSHKFEPKRP